MRSSRAPGAPADGRSHESPFRDAALAIAADLVASARPAGAGVTWEGDDLIGADERSMAIVRRPVGAPVYGGTAGIGWFLGHLAAVTKDATMADVAAAALRHALDGIRSGTASQDRSLFGGAAGVALAAVDAGGCLRRPSLSRAGRALARDVAAIVRDAPGEIDQLDLMGGLAGIVAGLLAIHRLAPDAAIAEACTIACDRLLDRRHVSGFGTSWPDQAHGSGPAWCGLGHGTSGIAWALAEAAWALDRPDLEPVIADALRYERGWFSADRCAWADLRNPPPATADPTWPAWTTAWCHGALGIGAVRLRLYEVRRDLTALAEASAALQAARGLVARASAALREGQASDVTLCHGLGGAVDLMLLAYEITGQIEHLRAARRAGNLCLAIHRANDRRWTVGTRGARLVPGLFLGSAGIGVMLMRLHDPACVGSPLLPGRPPHASGPRGPFARRHAPLAGTSDRP
jgi:lantibiotic modifying enzyme